MAERSRLAVVPILIVLAMLSLASCEVAPRRDALLLPVGRLVRPGNRITLAIDSQPFKADLVSDHSGGWWLRLPFRALKDRRLVQVHFDLGRLSEPLREDKIDEARWTSSTVLVDSDSPSILAAAKKIAAGRTVEADRAKAMLGYVQGLGSAPSPGTHGRKASETLAQGSGSCVNHARLFVALCRASGVAARTVSGTLVGAGGDGHHEWAEYYDRRGYWIPVDPTSDFDFARGSAGPRHIDLVYDIEANPIYPFDRGWERDGVALEDGDLSVFCADWGMQERSGWMGYRRLDGGNAAATELLVDYDLAKYRIE
jgi:transglutaminase-like putative cysteine protease